MPFVLLIFGIAFVMAGYHGNASQLFNKIGSEFVGTPSFGRWALAILVIGSLGFIRPLKPISNAFLILVLIVLFLSNRGFFASFNRQFGLV